MARAGLAVPLPWSCPTHHTQWTWTLFGHGRHERPAPHGCEWGRDWDKNKMTQTHKSRWQKGKVVGATEIPWAATDADQRMSSPPPLSSVRRVALSFKGVDTVTLGL